MKNALRGAAVTLAVALGFASTTAAPAAGETLTIQDARRDAASFNEYKNKVITSIIPNGDLLRVTYRHGRGRIAVRLKFGDLNREDVYLVSLPLTTDDGLRRILSVGHIESSFGTGAVLQRLGGKAVRCDVAHRFYFRRNLITASFPRTCVGDPRWVRIGASAWLSAMAPYLNDPNACTIDDAGRTEFRRGKRPPLSPRIHAD